MSAEPSSSEGSSRSWRTKLIHTERTVPAGFKSLVPAVYRGSTTVFERVADLSDRTRQPYTYGLYGTPTAHELGARVAEIENALHSFVLPSGQAAIALVYFTFCKSGSHVLAPKTAYGPNLELASDLLKGLGIEVEIYDPLIGRDIAGLIRDNTSLLWCESPGSITMEIQDVPAITAAAHARNVPVALDNTYAAGVLFDAFAHGVDISVQALTKYICGHSDALLGTVSVNTEALKRKVAAVYRLFGIGVSPEDCALALRGLQTLGVRLDALQAATLKVAGWLREQPGIARVLHPAFTDCAGHEIWKRDFTGSASLFSIVFDESWSPKQVIAFVDALEYFKIGYSWGGVVSLSMVYPGAYRDEYDMSRLVRLNIGLEDPNDLIADLWQALRHARGG